MKRKCENINLIVVCMIYGNISTVPVCAVLPWLPPAFESQTFDFTILIMVMMMRTMTMMKVMMMTSTAQGQGRVQDDTAR